MADYNSDRTGSNIDFTLDKVDVRDTVIDIGSNTTNRITVNSAGDVGIGTASPSGALTISGNFESNKAIVLANTQGTGKTSYIRSHGLDGDSLTLYHDGNQMQSWSSDGTIAFKSAGSEKARIDSSGNLLVGTTDTTLFNAATGGGILLDPNGPTTIARENVNGTLILNKTGGNEGLILEFRKDGEIVGSIGTRYDDIYIGNSGTGITMDATSSRVKPCSPASSGVLRDNAIDLGDPSARFKDIYLSGGVITSSDYRLKEDIQPMQSYADTVKQMNLVNFAWKESGTREDGFIAHELQALVPSAVRGDKDAIDEDGEAQHQGVDPLKLIPVLAKALQEALERIDILESK